MPNWLTFFGDERTFANAQASSRELGLVFIEVFIVINSDVQFSLPCLYRSPCLMLLWMTGVEKENLK